MVLVDTSVWIHFLLTGHRTRAVLFVWGDGSACEKTDSAAFRKPAEALPRHPKLSGFGDLRLGREPWRALRKVDAANVPERLSYGTAFLVN